MPTEAADHWGEDDRLEPPGLSTRTLLYLAAGMLVFMFVALSLLMVFFRIDVGGRYQMPTTKTFPDPRLETNINPRSMPDVAPGAAAIPRPFPVRTPASAHDLDQAMAMIAARGAKAYDSPDSSPPTPPPGRAQP